MVRHGYADQVWNWWMTGLALGAGLLSTPIYRKARKHYVKRLYEETAAYPTAPE